MADTSIGSRTPKIDGVAEFDDDNAAHFEQAPVAIAALNRDFRFVRSNRQFRELTGRSAEELQSLRMQDVTHADPHGHCAC